MFEKLLPIAGYLKEKTLFPTVKRGLSFIFVLGISSFLFEKFYFKYSLLDFTDYKAIYDFFAKGNFIIPFSIFFLIWASTNAIADFIFSVFNYLISEKFKSKIINYSVTKNESMKIMRKTDKMIKSKMIEKPKKEWFVLLYEMIEKSITKEQYQELVKNLNLLKKSLSNDAVLIFRAVIAICLYFISISYFGWVLFVILIIVLLVCITLLVFGYQIAELLPYAIQKVMLEIKSYIKENYPENNDVQPK